jgi:hypothetical protein
MPHALNVIGKRGLQVHEAQVPGFCYPLCRKDPHAATIVRAVAQYEWTSALVNCQECRRINQERKTNES